MFLITLLFLLSIAFFNGSFRASDNREYFYFVCTHCCHKLLCFNRSIVIIKRDKTTALFCDFFSGLVLWIPSRADVQGIAQWLENLIVDPEVAG